jgi:hypothetical protein
MTSFEPLFLQRARQHLDSSLAYADRLLDFLWANVTLTPHYGRKGRLTESQQMTSTAVRFAIACNLHQPDIPSPLLKEAPRNHIEAAERANLWAGVYLTHTIVRTFTSDENSVPEEVRSN